MMRKILLSAIVTMFTMFVNATFYVVPGGAGSNDGTSWENAYGDIQTAINAASALYVSSSAPQEVWVKAGTYSTASAALLLKESVSIYGGFNGTETDKAQRSKGVNAWDYTNVSTLNGGGSKRCIEISANLSNITTIDGFTITNGNGTGTQLSGNGGGALIRSNLKLQNCIVTGNTATGNGGGVNAAAGIISSCWIYNNATTSATVPSAGGVYSAPATGLNTIIEKSLIERNAQGGLRLQSAGTITMDGCIIRNNTSTGNGAAIYTNNPTNCTITNCLITNNSGGNNIYLNKGKLINSTVANNEGGIYLASATNIAEVYNNIIVNNVVKGTTTPSSISVVTGYPAGKVKNNATWPSVAYQSWGGSTDSILTNSPAEAISQVSFAAPTAFRGRVLNNVDSLNMISSADWSVTSNSVCLNKGDNSLIPAGISNDFAGLARIESSSVDAGAFELPYYNTTITFNAGGTVDSYTSGDIISKPKGTVLSFVITPASGKGIQSILYNGVEVKNNLTGLHGATYYFGGTYTSSALSAASAFEVIFENDVTTSVVNTTEKNQIFNSGNELIIYGLDKGEKITVFSLSGTVVNSSISDDNVVRLHLQKGIYLVKVASIVEKVVIW